MTVGDLVRLLRLEGGRVSIVEMTLPAGSPAAGRPLYELRLPPDSADRRGPARGPRGDPAARDRARRRRRGRRARARRRRSRRCATRRRRRMAGGTPRDGVGGATDPARLAASRTRTAGSSCDDAPRCSPSTPSTTTRVPSARPGIARRPMNTTVTSPVPSETTASSDSLPSIGKHGDPAAPRRRSCTRSRSGASAIRTVPGTVSAHSRISSARRASSLSVSLPKKRRRAPIASDRGYGPLDHRRAIWLALSDVRRRARTCASSTCRSSTPRIATATTATDDPERGVVGVRHHERGDQQRHEVHHLDQRVERGTGRVLERVADRVADHRGLVARRPLPPKWPSSMYFFALSHAPPAFDSITASSWPVRIEPGQERAERLGLQEEAGDDRGEHRQQARRHQLAQRGLRADVDHARRSPASRCSP